jgi:uncharacterized protein YktB (UPF0637 family)
MFPGFTKKDFATFSINGLEERMSAIQQRIQPKFREIGEVLCGDLSAVSGNEMFLHVAKHARRTVNPPKDTWLAICHDKRGYKKHPHFQVGLFDDHVFVWFALIYEAPNKKQIAENFLNNLDEVFETIPKDFVISLDHMKKEAYAVKDLDKPDLENMLLRFRDVKKAEFLVGRHVDANDSILSDGNRFMAFTKETMQTLMPLYKMSF